MRYIITNFKKAIPSIEGMRLISSVDIYQIFELTEEAWENFPPDQPKEEITELEGTQGWKFYSNVRGYRSAYSDAEGLEPDQEYLDKGQRKTKVYMTEEITQATVTLMKRVFKKNVCDVFDCRDCRDEEENIMSLIDSLTTIKEICLERERLLGIEMSKHQLMELGEWDEETNSRKNRHTFAIGF